LGRRATLAAESWLDALDRDSYVGELEALGRRTAFAQRVRSAFLERLANHDSEIIAETVPDSRNDPLAGVHVPRPGRLDHLEPTLELQLPRLRHGRIFAFATGPREVVVFDGSARPPSPPAKSATVVDAAFARLLVDTGEVRITLNELTVSIEHLDRERLLGDWRWLIGSSKQPILLSAIGDAFVQDDDDGTIHLLDTAAGTCQLVAANQAELRNLMSDSRWVTDHLAVEPVADFLANGLRLEPGQIYSWKHPPALGGEYAFENVATADIEVHFSITGHLHEQIRSLPPGTPIDQVRFAPGTD
jgi:hypothetical protein